MSTNRPGKRAIEVGFPIVEINRLAVPERNSFKPIYQMHKWFARRASCVFRAILLGTLKPALQPDGTPTDLMAEFYKDHTNDPDTKDTVVLDPFMGGGTTVVEALRLGCRVIGIDLNPVAWFIVKTEIEPVDLEALRAAYDRLAERPVAWNGGRPVKETLLSLYKTEAAGDVEADVIYTFWVKSAICTDPNCRREVPLFKEYIIAQKAPKIRYHRDADCPACKKTFDWEVDVASLIAEPALMVNAPRGSGGEGRPTQRWVYAPEPPKPRGRGASAQTDVECPHCRNTIRVQVPSAKKPTKPIQLTVLLCPACEAVWQWRGPLPDGEITCPSCRHSYDPRKGNVPEKGRFQCACGQRDAIIASIRSLPQDRRLPIRPYAIQAYLPPLRPDDVTTQETAQISLPVAAPSAQPFPTERGASPSGLLIPSNGKFFKRFTVSDMRRLQGAETLWERHKTNLPYPKSAIPRGAETNRLLEHHYNDWSDMFSPRQLLALSTLLQGIMAEEDQTLKEMLLSSFFSALEGSNLFARFKTNQDRSETSKGVFARHDFQPKLTPVEDNVWGAEIGKGFRAWFEIVIDGKQFAQVPSDNYYHATANGQKLERRADGSRAVSKVSSETLDGEAKTILRCHSLLDATPPTQFNYVVTDPPYVGNVNYAELADFFYVWLRLALKEHHLQFAPEYTPKAEEIIENPTRGKTREHFFEGLLSSFRNVCSQLSLDGLLVFTFHHTDQQGHVWEGLLQSICQAGLEIVSVYPIHADSETSLHLMDKENVSYDLIHVCRKRREDPRPRSWAGIRQEVRRKAREELQAIEKGRYGNQPLPEPDVRLICIGKCLELYSAHYNKVLDHEGTPLPLHKALQDISAIVDQLVTRDRPLPAELGAVDALSYVWLRVLAPIRNEIMVDAISKAVRGMRVSVDDLKDAGLLVRGRTGRGRTYEVKQPVDRLDGLVRQYQPGLAMRPTQGELFTGEGEAILYGILLVDLLHLLIGLAAAGESVVPWLERFSGMRQQLRAALAFVRELRADWKEPIGRVMALIEGPPLLRRMERS
ncbi:DNA methyltransferase [Candidatus Methylomirabilis sp.]|uniref:DNA methyltransferase n=1 Tax=Candidatus Methylomirabilis sp. TaxID=2032687 RepID=UPI003076273F